MLPTVLVGQLKGIDTVKLDKEKSISDLVGYLGPLTLTSLCVVQKTSKRQKVSGTQFLSWFPILAMDIVSAYSVFFKAVSSAGSLPQLNFAQEITGFAKGFGAHKVHPILFGNQRLYEGVCVWSSHLTCQCNFKSPDPARSEPSEREGIK